MARYGEAQKDMPSLYKTEVRLGSPRDKAAGMTGAQPPVPHLRLGIAMLGTILSVASPGVAQTRPPADDPIDKTWQEANRKYDGPRARLVETVNRGAVGGP